MTAADTRNSKRKPWSEALATFFICLALGPPIGGIVFTFGLLLTPALGGVPHAPGTGFPELLVTGLWLGLFAVPFSYLVGGLQAGAVGLAFASYGWFTGRLPFWVAVAAGAAVYLAALASGWSEVEEMAVAMVFVHAVPTLLSWLVVRNLWREGRS